LNDRIVLRTNARLGSFYKEAVRSLREGDVDVRIAVSGHMLRELLDGLRKDMEVEKAEGGAGKFWAWVREEWDKVTTKRPVTAGKRLWSTELVGKLLGGFLAGLHREFLRMSVLMPARRVQHEQTLAKLDAGFAGAPEKVRDDLVGVWGQFSDAFNSATHSADPDEFEELVERFEDFLRDRLIPRTFEKQSAIEDFVRRVEAGG